MAVASGRSQPPIAPQALQATLLDRVSSFLMAAIAGLIISAGILSVAWFATRLPRRSLAVPVEIVELTGGSEDGAVGETLEVDSLLPPAEDASLAEVVSDETEIKETLETILDSSETAVELTQEQLDTGLQNTGKVGARKGTGRRSLGSGPGQGGFPREQRWLIRYPEGQTFEEYAKQLDFFGVELGTIRDGKLALVSNFSAAKPSVRTVESGKDETRLYMTWQGGNRRQADLQAFRKAGIDVGGAPILQFYSKDAENRLAALELEYKNKKVSEIRRTYFEVKTERGSYEFYVTRQVLMK